MAEARTGFVGALFCFEKERKHLRPSKPIGELSVGRSPWISAFVVMIEPHRPGADIEMPHDTLRNSMAKRPHFATF